MTDGAFSRELPTGVESFLVAHPDAQVAVLEEPVFQRVPNRQINPFLNQFEEPPFLRNFGRATHASVIQAIRAARLDGAAHIRVHLFDQPTHVSVVSMIGTPFLIMLVHPTEGIGRCDERADVEGVSIYRGQCDSKLRLLNVDDALARAAGISEGELSSRELGSLVHPESAAELLDCWVDSSALGAASCTVRLPNTTTDESDRWFQATLIANGEQTNFVFVDATNNPRAKRSQDHRSRLHTITETVPQGIFRVSSRGKLLYKNSKLDQIFARELLDSQDFSDVVTVTGEPVAIMIPKMLSDGVDEGVLDIDWPVDGEDRTIRIRVRSYPGIDGRPEYVGSAEDITEEKLRSSQLEADALTDPMTGTGNRRALELSLSELLDDPKISKFGVLLCDLDGFKQVNDSLGHGAGDDVIAELGNLGIVEQLAQ